MLEHQAEFVNAIRSSKMRERLFDAMEQYYSHDFGNGRGGKGFYEQLLLAVRAAGSPEAIKEFEIRFSPFLNPDQKHLNADDVGDLEGITNPELTARRCKIDRAVSGIGYLLHTWLHSWARSSLG